MQVSDFSRSFGLRVGLWYATLFVLGAIAIVYLTYALTAASLAQRDRQIIQAKLGAYSAVYDQGGIQALAETVQAEQRTAPERLFVRIVARGSEALVLSGVEGWELSTLEVGSLRFPDGTLVQVGKSTEARQEMLSRFRATLGLITLSIVVVALTGGWLATQSAVQPIRRLAEIVRRIVATGRTDERVVVGRAGDAIAELTQLFNAMLDRIEGLVRGMRGALDNVSHDLRTPLTRLRGAAETALAGPVDLERYRGALADCVEETDHVLVMLDALMDISEAESGALVLRREDVPLDEVVERAVDLYREVAESKGVLLLVESAPGVVVNGDRVRLQQAAANLLDNAVKYTPSGGRVVVRVGLQSGRGILSISDTGMGIPREELPQIWERLFRGDTSRTERGLGLGLSLVKAIVEAHGGTVGVISEPGQGSTFDVALPLASNVPPKPTGP